MLKKVTQSPYLTDTLGGLVSSFEIEGQNLERAYHFLYKIDHDIIGLVEELNIRTKLHFYDSSLATYYSGKLYPIMRPSLNRLPLWPGLGYIWIIYRIKPRSPQLNGKVERSRRTDQEEFYQLLTYTDDLVLNKKRLYK